MKQRKVGGSHLVGTTLRPYSTCYHGEENHLDATRERHAITLNSEEGTIFLNVILPIAYSKLCRGSGPNKMAPLASVLLEREQ